MVNVGVCAVTGLLTSNDKTSKVFFTGPLLGGKLHIGGRVLKSLRRHDPDQVYEYDLSG